jgi:protein-L-isoaspartate(D-aspartate) O-methyltransferase
MTQLLLEDGMPFSVLEIGTGCGYQTAILASIFSQVYSVERIEALYQQARRRLDELEFYNVQLRHTDGSAGWPNLSYEFDRIIMTAACTEIPEALLAQLRMGGVMVLPYDDGSGQTMMKITRNPDGLVSEALEKVVFVPLLPGLE